MPIRSCICLSLRTLVHQWFWAVARPLKIACDSTVNPCGCWWSLPLSPTYAPFSPHSTPPPPPAERPTESTAWSSARPGESDPPPHKRGARRWRRESTFRPRPQPYGGSNTSIGIYFSGNQGVTASEREIQSQKSLACSTPPGTGFPSLITTNQPY